MPLFHFLQVPQAGVGCSLGPRRAKRKSWQRYQRLPSYYWHPTVPPRPPWITGRFRGQTLPAGSGLETTSLARPSLQVFNFSSHAHSEFAVPQRPGPIPRGQFRGRGPWTPPSHLLGQNRSDEVATARQSLIILGFIEMRRRAIPGTLCTKLNYSNVFKSF